MTRLNPDKMPRAVIYTRVSSREQLKNLSLETQRKACEEYCARAGYSVARVFVEEGESARTADRTQLQELLRYLLEERGKIAAVIVYNVSRFARDRADHVTLRVYLQGMGVTLRSATESFDDSASGRFMEDVLSAVAQLDNAVRGERSRAGMQAALEKGKWHARPPVGYMKAPAEQGGRMVPDPTSAPLITLAFETYATGLYTKQQVLEMVTARGLHMPSGKKLSKQDLTKILGRELYAGMVSSRKLGGRYRGVHEPLVSEETFAQVQQLISGRRQSLTPHLRNHPDFPLRGFVRCGQCGRSLTGSWSKGRSKAYGYYRCLGNCRGSSARKHELEGMFLSLLDRVTPRQEYVALFRALVLDAWEDRETRAKAQLADQRRHTEATAAKIDRLETAFLFERTIDADTYSRQHAKLQEELLLSKMELHDAEIDALDLGGLLDYAEQVLASPARQWLDASADQKQRLQKVLLPGGVVFANGELGTTEICVAFELLPHSESGAEALVPEEGLVNPGCPKIARRPSDSLEVRPHERRELRWIKVAPRSQRTGARENHGPLSFGTGGGT